MGYTVNSDSELIKSSSSHNLDLRILKSLYSIKTRPKLIGNTIALPAYHVLFMFYDKLDTFFCACTFTIMFITDTYKQNETVLEKKLSKQWQTVVGNKSLRICQFAAVQNMSKPSPEFSKINDNRRRLLIEIIAKYIMTPKSCQNLPYSAECRLVSGI